MELTDEASGGGQLSIAPGGSGSIDLALDERQRLASRFVDAEEAWSARQSALLECFHQSAAERSAWPGCAADRLAGADDATARIGGWQGDLIVHTVEAAVAEPSR